ncbi:MAG: hypothetical protein M1832_000211 [Thelocarpon impressellum]|nr:MAG: hypothetical protein M1832_000211 [Thelocarpon impressellum]
MAEEHLTIASAVVVPDPTEPAAPSPPALGKRRQSPTSDSGGKRPRLDAGQDEQVSTGPAGQGDRRSSHKAEERKRGQRLFGALLGTLSQSPSTNAAQRRADIEKKQQAKLKQQAADYDEKKRERTRELLAVRRREQKRFDEQSMRIRHSNTLAMARCLHTSAEPRLYYKPWELRPAEKARIKGQIEEAEATVAREVREHEERRRLDAEQETAAEGPPRTTDAANGGAVQDPGGHTVGLESKQAESTHVESTDVESTHVETIHVESTDHGPSPAPAPPASPPPEPVREHIEDGDGAEVVLEADEDTVIY